MNRKSEIEKYEKKYWQKTVQNSYKSLCAVASVWVYVGVYVCVYML